MRFVATKTPEQQSGLMLHRTRHLFPVTTIQHEGSFVKIDAVGDPPLGRCARYKNRVIVPKSNRSKSRAGRGSKIGSGRTLTAFEQR